ncbi:MAG: hypothetical protein V4495_21905 [Pseudomonadota bacterium]
MVATAAGVASAAASVYSSTKSPSQQTSSSQQQLDPRIANMLFGAGRQLKPDAQPTGTDENGDPVYADTDYTNNPGLLSRYQGLLDKPQNPGLQNFGNFTDAYLNNNAGYDIGQQRNTSWDLMRSNFQAPFMQAAQGSNTAPLSVMQSQMPSAYAPVNAGVAQADKATAINAPGQNNLSLNPAFSDLIFGSPGNNPFLAGAIQKGLNQSAAQFQNLQADAMKQFNEEALPALRGDAIVNGQYGGSRQGIAEGKAADSLARNMSRALSQVGQNMTDAAVSAQASQYGQDRQNQLNAAMGLSGQQYGVASTNAGAQNQVNLANAQMANQGNQFNASSANTALNNLFNAGLQNNQFNASAMNNANAMMYQGNQAMNLANLGNRQQANQQNGAWQIANNQLNSQNQTAGVGLTSNLLNSVYGMANNQNDYLINQAGKVNGLLGPYLSSNSSQVSTAPLYQNQGANALGGIMAGLQVYKTLGGGKDN